MAPFSHTSDDLISIPNYKLFRNDGDRGDGVCIYIRNTLKTHVVTLHKLDEQTPPGIELYSIVCYQLLLLAVFTKGLSCLFRIYNVICWNHWVSERKLTSF